MFKGPGCFENHQRVGVSGGMSVCQTYTKCQECGKVADLSQRSKEEHNCGEVRCPTCRKYDNPETHRCFMEPPKKKRKRNREGSDDQEKDEEQKTSFLLFDFERMQETGVHLPNLMVIQDADGHEWVFKGAFCDLWFGGTMDGSVCIAHNFKGFDSYFILKYLYDNKVRPVLIMNGANIMEMTVAESDTRFIESLNFLHVPLSK